MDETEIKKVRYNPDFFLTDIKMICITDNSKT